MKKSIVLFIVSLFTLSTFAQEQLTTKSKKAEKIYRESDSKVYRMDYGNAINLLLEALEYDSTFIEAHQRLGDVYRETNQIDLAKKEYEKVIELNPEFTKNCYFSLGEIEMFQGEYTKAKKHFQKYLTFKNPNKGRLALAQANINNCEFAETAMKNPVPFNPINLGKNVNSPESEYLPCITADGKTLIVTRRGKYGEDFYESKFIDGAWTLAKPLSDLINTPDNEGAECISPDGRILYFTGCGRRDGLGSCDLYYSIKEGDSWSAPKNLGPPVNSNYWESQPTIAPDGKTIYFASDRPGGIGSYDIWKTEYLGNGAWSEPKNLGPKINTKKSEISPFMHVDNQTFYFCSDGWPGMGNKDIFYSKLNAKGEFSEPTNLGYPINTFKDESCPIISSDGRTAYFASNSLTGEGEYDIFSFEIPEQARAIATSYVKGKVFDKDSRANLKAGFDVIELKSGKSIVNSITGNNGEFLVCIPAGQDYLLNVNRPGYLFYSDNFSLKDFVDSKPFPLDVPLQKIKTGEKVVLKNIFFETASFELKPESKSELDKTKAFLISNSSVRVEIGGHTDNVGSDQANKILSTNRAKAVYDYLILNGIDAGRLAFKGYGKDVPVQSNDTEEGRALNRRTEMKIL